MKRGERYAKARKLLGLSQEQLAEIIPITQTSISKMEQDKFEKPNQVYTDYLVEQGYNRLWLTKEKGDMKTKDNNFSFGKQEEKEYSEKEENSFPPETIEILQEILKQQEKNGKMLDNILNNLSRAFTIIENLTSSNGNSVNLGKHKAYTTQPLFNNSAVYAHS